MKYYKIIILSMLLILFLKSCKRYDNKQEMLKQTIVMDSVQQLTESNMNSEGAFLFNNGKETIINWTEWSHEKEKNILKFAFFDKETKRFMNTQEVPVSLGLQMHAESMAKVAINSKGILYAVFRLKPAKDKSRFGGLLYYSVSKDRGSTWSEKTRLVEDTLSVSQSFYDIALLPDGNLGMTWLDSREIDTIHKGKTVFFARTNLETGFMKEKPIAVSTCECCRTEIFVDSTKRIHVAYRNIIERGEKNYSDNYGTTNLEIRDMYYIYSDDEAKTFSVPIPISRDNWHINGCPHTGPSLALNKNKLGAVWFTAANSKAGLYFTTKENNVFDKRMLLTSEGKHPQMVVLKNRFFIVYEEYYEQNEKGFTRVILESIDEKGIRDITEITKPSTNNNHTVITSLNADTVLLAWVNTDTRAPKIKYKSFKVY